MRKIYSLLLMLVMGVCFSFSTHAASVTVKVNDTGIGKVYFSSYGPSNETIITSAQQELPADVGGDCVGSMYCPAGYTMTAWNESANVEIEVYKYDGKDCFNINPGVTPPGTVISITVTESAGGGEGDDPVEQNVTFVFNPEGCAYVVTCHTEFSGYDPIEVEDETYNTPNNNGEIVVPYKEGTYLIKPNAGYTLTQALDEEAAKSNPHYSPVTPTGDGIITLESGAFDAGTVFVVSATKPGSFQVKGFGSNIENIKFVNNVNYNELTVTDEFTTVNFTNETYTISSGYGSNGSYNPLWKVEVTDSDNYTRELEGTGGRFPYTPNDGDLVVVFTDRPITYANVKIGYEGEGVSKSIVDKVEYNGEEVSSDSWGSSNGWTVTAGNTLKIYFNITGFENIKYSVNGGVAQSLSSSYDYSQSVNRYYGEINIENDDTSETKEYNITISAEKEKTFDVTFVCDHPEAIVLNSMDGWTVKDVIPFTSSPYVRNVTSSTSKFKISAANADWQITGIDINGEAVSSSQIQGGSFSYQPTEECTVTITVADLSADRTNTAVVYVGTAKSGVYDNMAPTIQYNTGGTVTLSYGYNFVPFGPSDCPFNFTFAVRSNNATYYVNGEKVSIPYGCPQTEGFEDGGVIKYFDGEQTANVVSYSFDDSVKDLVEIYHDHRTGIDHNTATEYACLPGTIIHIKPKAEVSQADVRTRAESTPKFYVSVNNTTLTPDDNGVYSYEVNDKADIKVTKDEPTGVEENFANETEVFNVYNMQGVVVKRNATSEDLNALPGGIYIANGRKVIVK